MKPLFLCYYSPFALELPSLINGIQKIKDKDNIPLKVIVRTGSQLSKDTEIQKNFINHCLKADAIFIVLHGSKSSCPVFDALIKALLEKKALKEKIPYLFIYALDEEIDLIQSLNPDFGNPAWQTLSRYISYGGSFNFYNMLKYIYSYLFKVNLNFDKPVKPPEEGIYHPDFSKIFTDLEEYYSLKINPQKPIIGIWFYQHYWLNDDLDYIDALIKNIEAQDANAIAVFHLRYRDAERGNKGADFVVKKFFKKEKKTIIDCLISPMMFSLNLFSPEYKGLLKYLDVPVLQVIPMWGSYESWKNSMQGLSSMDIAYSIAQPEIDGTLITVPVAYKEEKTIDPLTGALIAKYYPIPERIKKVVSLALNWANLRRKKNKDKKVAIIFHNYPPRNDRIGCAAGLDSFESIKNLIDCLKVEGYYVKKTYKNGKEIINELLSRFTYDQKWLNSENMKNLAEVVANEEELEKYFKNLPCTIRKKLKEDWGDFPGSLFVQDKTFCFPGIINGNLFITIQPPRGYLENIQKIYHDSHLSPPYYYLAFYKWIKHIFKADAVIHVGKHGSLEWLPGKSVGLSEECYPDIAIMDLPNIYPYIINDPGEGTQAKRRSYCCIIDHLTPVFTNADLYEELAKLDNLLNEYRIAQTDDPKKIEVLKSLIWEAFCKAKLDKDLNINRETAFKDFESFLKKIHDYLEEIEDTIINDGLHILGMPPEREKLANFLIQLTRLKNKDIPSLRETVLNLLKFKYQNSLKQRRELLKEANQLSLLIIKELQKRNFSNKDLNAISKTYFGKVEEDLIKVLKYICEELVFKINETRNEIRAIIDALSGKFVLPGPSGAPTRGQAEILPTGRNFYSVDPQKIPTPSAWEIGKKLAEELIKKSLESTGKYPSTIGIILWGTSTMRTRGDDIAEILYLMGLKPRWAKGSGNIEGLEIIPLEKLGRPRIDVNVRISGFFRDAFPNLIELLDEAVKLVSQLNEPSEKNMIKKHVWEDFQNYLKKGMSEEQAFREATFRVFGCPPGTYGAGVSELIESKNWKNQEDLGNIYITWSAHAYGKNSFGLKKVENFKALLYRTDITVKNEDSREYDILSCTDYYNYYGGLIAAIKTVKGKYPLSYVGDSSNPEQIKIRTLKEETQHILRARIFNPKWIEGMKRHGYKGAGDLSYIFDITFGWDATAETIEDWMYEKLAEKYVFDEDMRNWLEKINPYALQNMVEKLLEAISRGMWKPESNVKNKLKKIYLEIEGKLENITG